VWTPTISPELVTLPDAGYLPRAHGGEVCFWFGSDTLTPGTFLGEYWPDLQAPLGGGTSTGVQAAVLLSPPIALTGLGGVSLHFWTWWEIEGIEVAAGEFDQMELHLVTAGGEWRLLGTINPRDDTQGEAFRPYSSGGPGAPGVWVPVTADLSAFAGETVQIGFRFDSGDNLYNGFRGWLIDDVAVVGGPLPGPALTAVLPGAGVGDDVIQASGAGFAVGATLMLDHVEVPAAVVSDNLVLFDVPGYLEAGPHDVTVTNPDGQSATLAGGFVFGGAVPPTVLAITPASGPAYGGVPVTITGTGFATGAQVQIGGCPATGVTVVDSEHIVGVAPTCLAPGFHNLEVTNPDGLSDALFGAYEATAGGDCDDVPWNFVRLLDVRYRSVGLFPDVVATVLVDTPAGRECLLGAADFALTEDGVRQTLGAFASGPAADPRADIVFVIDDTGDLSGPIAALQAGIGRFAAELAGTGVDARFALVSFGGRQEIAVELPFSACAENLEARLNTLSAAGAVGAPRAALDAIWTAATELHWRPEAQRYFVLVTDAATHHAGDGSGLADRGMSETVALVEGMGGSVFALGPALDKGPGPAGRGPGVLPKAYGDASDVRTLAHDTGGDWRDIAAVDVGPWLDWLARAIGSVYTLTYTSSSPVRDGTWRRVVVTATDPWGGVAKTDWPVPITDCDDGRYQAPQETLACDQGEADSVQVTAVGWVAPERFPEVRATVRVDTTAGAACGLTREHFAVAEDGVWHTVTSVTCDDTTELALYSVVYTSRNGAPDGSSRQVVVQVSDPLAGTDCDGNTYQAPAAPDQCSGAQSQGGVHIMGLQYAEDSIFPQVTATLRVDSAAGRACTLTGADFALSENGVVQGLTSATCAGTGGSVADIAFCLDSTGTMAEGIAAMRTRATQFVQGLAAVGVDARVALVSFRDEAVLELGLTDDAAAFQAAVDGLLASGGGDLPEASLDAVMLALSPALAWRAGAQRLIVVVTDAPAHYRGDGTAFSAYTLDDTIRAALAAGASVCALGPDSGKALRREWGGEVSGQKAAGDQPDDIRVLVEATGGLWADVGGTGVDAFVDELLAAVTSLYTVTYTTTNTRRDGTWRQVAVAATDPVAGSACDDGWYRAPLECLELAVTPTEMAVACLTGTSPEAATLRVANACAGRLGYTITADAPWLSVAPEAGASSGDWNDHRVEFDTAWLPPGTYAGDIVVTGSGQTGTVTVHLAVTDLLVSRSFPDDCRGPGDLVEVAVTFQLAGLGAVTSLALHEALPNGWSFDQVVSGSPLPETRFGSSPRELAFDWTETPAFPYTLVYRVVAPDAKAAGSRSYGQHCFAGQVAYDTGGGEAWTEVYGEPCIEVRDCTQPCVPHQADQNGNGVVELTPELTRMIQFYNRRGYHSQAGTEDGYAPGAGATYGGPHQADQNHDWVIQLSPELTRLIQFYNSGGYHCEAGTEDGYAPDLPARKATGSKGTLTSARSFGNPLYQAGTTLEVSVTLTHTAPASLTSLAVQETLPTGWSLNSVVTTPPPTIRPAPGATGALGFAWVSMPTVWPVTLTYRVNVPAGTVGPKTFTGTASFRDYAGETTVTTAATVIQGNEATVTFAAGAGGNLTGTLVQTVPAGTSTTAVTAVPLATHRFLPWTRGGAHYSNDNPLTVDSVTEDMTLTAVFEPSNHPVTFVAEAGGNLVGVLVQTVPVGTSTTPVTAVPLATHRFVHWTRGGAHYSNDNPLTVTNVTEDMTLTAVFTPNNHTVTYAVDVAGRGVMVGTNPQTVLHGGNGTAVTAQASYGFVFVQWNDGLTTASRTETNVTEDRAFAATFRAANAVPPPWNGTFTAVTDAAAVAVGRGLWDFTGPYATAVAGRTLTLDPLMDPKGKIAGMARLTLARDTVLDLPIKGSAKGSAGALGVRLSLKGTTPDRTASASLALTLGLDPSMRQLTGPATGTITVGGTKTPVNEDLTLEIPPPMDGTWTLLLDLVPGDKGLAGTATLTVSNGAEYEFLIKGKVAGQTAVLSLTGAPTDPLAKAIRMKAAVLPQEGAWAVLQTFSAKGFGQGLGW
jgi:hypothetical protein